jgi:spore germination cell wall hydrolase CwlJ-like protein
MEVYIQKMRLITDAALAIVTIYQEAEGEPYEGKQAVAEVILRRTKNRFFSDGTIAGTVLRKLQFSGWNHNAPNRIRSLKIDSSDPIVNDCVKAWTAAEQGSEIVPDCMHFFNPAIGMPKWAEDAKIVADIGRHRFVIPKGG